MKILELFKGLWEKKEVIRFGLLSWFEGSVRWTGSFFKKKVEKNVWNINRSVWQWVAV